MATVFGLVYFQEKQIIHKQLNVSEPQSLLTQDI